VTINLVDEAVKAGARLESACEEAGIDVRTIQRWKRRPDGEDRRRGPTTRPANALSSTEEQELVELLNSPEFVDLSPNQVVPKLADMKIYKASERTMYRILKKRKLLAHRGRSRPRTSKRPAERRATGPRQSWSWDITYLRSPVRGVFLAAVHGGRCLEPQNRCRQGACARIRRAGGGVAPGGVPSRGGQARAAGSPQRQRPRYEGPRPC
jgi:transposase